MSNQNQGLTVWGDKGEVIATGNRLKALLPGGDKLTDNDAMSLAQYAIMTDTNPFRGEVYGFKSGNRFVIVEGYKALVRWAKRQSEFTERYTELTDDEMESHGLTAGDIAVNCSILRNDKRDDVKFFVECGASFAEAVAQASVEAVGVVTKKDMTGQGGPIDPPKGWSWRQVAEKRALKNAINRAYGLPSPKEIANSYQSSGMPFDERVELLRGPAEGGIE